MASQPPTDPDTETVVESESTTSQGAINLDQAMKYVQALDDTMEWMNTKATKEMTQDIVRDVLEEIKNIVADLTPQMGEANIDHIWKSIKDLTCITLRPAIKENEKALEEMMPPDDIMPGKSSCEQAKQKGQLTE